MKTVLTPGIVTSLPGRYAKALFDLAQEENQISEIESSLSAFQKLIHTSKPLKQTLVNPKISQREREAVMNAICTKMGTPQIFQSFISHLIKAHRISCLFQIEEIYRNLVSQSKKEQVIEVISAHPLTSTQTHFLKDQLKSAFSGTLSLVFVNDPAILGGVMVRIGSRTFDATLISQLNKLALVMKGNT